AVTLSVGAAVEGSPGRLTVVWSWPVALLMAPDLLSASFTPKGMTGRVSSSASDSSLVSALASRLDSWTFCAWTCQSCRWSAVLVGLDLSQPQRRVRKYLADLGLHQRLGGLELRQPVTDLIVIVAASSASRQNHRLGSGLTLKIEAERGLGAYAVVGRAIEK